MGKKAIEHIHTIVSNPEHDEYGTPKWLVQWYSNFLSIIPKLDVCASEHIHVCDRYYTKEDNMFEHVADVDFFMNPFYSGIDECMKWAVRQVKENHVKGLLCVNAQVGAGWFQDNIWKPYKKNLKERINNNETPRLVEVEFHPHRIKFLDRFGNIPVTRSKDNGKFRENTAMYWTAFVGLYPED